METEEKVKIDWKSGEHSYQPADKSNYYYTKKGVTPYNCKDFLLFRSKTVGKIYGYFTSKYDGEIKLPIRYDKFNFPIRKGDFVYVTSKKDHGFFRVVGYKPKALIVIEDLDEGGRVGVKPEDLIVMTSQVREYEQRRRELAQTKDMIEAIKNAPPPSKAKERSKAKKASSLI